MKKAPLIPGVKITKTGQEEALTQGMKINHMRHLSVTEQGEELCFYKSNRNEPVPPDPAIISAVKPAVICPPTKKEAIPPNIEPGKILEKLPPTMNWSDQPRRVKEIPSPAHSVFVTPIIPSTSNSVESNTTKVDEIAKNSAEPDTSKVNQASKILPEAGATNSGTKLPKAAALSATKPQESVKPTAEATATTEAVKPVAKPTVKKMESTKSLHSKSTAPGTVSAKESNPPVESATISSGSWTMKGLKSLHAISDSAQDAGSVKSSNQPLKPATASSETRPKPLKSMHEMWKIVPAWYRPSTGGKSPDHAQQTKPATVSSGTQAVNPFLMPGRVAGQGLTKNPFFKSTAGAGPAASGNPFLKPSGNSKAADPSVYGNKAENPSARSTIVKKQPSQIPVSTNSKPSTTSTSITENALVDMLKQLSMQDGLPKLFLQNGGEIRKVKVVTQLTKRELVVINCSNEATDVLIALEKLMFTMTHTANESPVPVRAIEKNALYSYRPPHSIAKIQFRVQLLSLTSSDKACVLLIDHGEVREIEPKHLFPLQPDWKKLDEQSCHVCCDKDLRVDVTGKIIMVRPIRCIPIKVAIIPGNLDEDIEVGGCEVAVTVT